MRTILPATTVDALVCLLGAGHTQRQRLNPVIALLEQHKPVFGVYAPGNGGRRGEPVQARPAIDLARDALAYRTADFLYPSNAGDIEMRMKQGFSVFVMNWGDSGFKAVGIGRQAARRP
jgi:hypothetical protein